MRKYQADLINHLKKSDLMIKTTYVSRAESWQNSQKGLWKCMEFLQKLNMNRIVEFCLIVHI